MKSDFGYTIFPTLRCCTFSRVMKEKGIEDAVDATNKLNEQFGRNVFELDIYGQIDSEQSAWFKDLTGKFSPAINYRGAVPSTESTKVLAKYDILLFPTYYAGEGFAGTIIDAFAAGIPVIASDWKYNSEIVSDETGYVFCSHDLDDLSKKMMEAYLNPLGRINKKRNCIQCSALYKPEIVIQTICNNLL